MFLKGVYQFAILYSDILVGAHIFGVPFPKQQTLSEIFWALRIYYSQYEKTILRVFVYLSIYEVATRKFYIRRNNNKVDSIETGRMVIAHLLP